MKNRVSIPGSSRQSNWARRLFTSVATLIAACAGPWAALAANGDIVINELMYNPPGEADSLQFIELFNRGEREVNLGHWSLAKGVKFTFPDNTQLGPKSYLVVCGDRSAFLAHYGAEVRALGNFTGRLSHRSERVELLNAQNELADSLKYLDASPWPAGPDGYSSSLERICPWSESDQPPNWAASRLPAVKRASGTPGRQNDSYAAQLPPVISKVEFSPHSPTPMQPVKVTVAVQHTDPVRSVTVLYRVAATGREGEEKPIVMSRVSGDDRRGTFEATIEGQPQGQLIRFRIKAVDGAGVERLQPGADEPRPAYSYFAFTNSAPAGIPIAALINVGRPARGPGHYERNPSRRAGAGRPSRGTGAVLYVPADGTGAQTFDYVQIIGRHGGYKVHMPKDRPLKGMTAINLISEGPMRWILAEPLAYSLYRLAGVPAPLTEHVRLSMDGRALGFHLLVEQPNASFLTRNGRDESGDLFKLLWYGNGIVGQHEKKNNLATGHGELVRLIEGLRRRSGADQWAFIQQNFNVEECINYYAVNMCIQNWDGFFNNYFTYRDTAGTGKWEIFPWDEDKTWGDYDGASARYDWYEMPLTTGMNGDSSPHDMRSRFGGGGPFGGVSWWRPPGYFSGPLLANPQFRKQFLERLREICLNTFTEETFFPIINAMEQRLEPEVRLRAEALGQDPKRALREFAGYMQSFRSQVQNRRKFILGELKP